MVVHIKSKNEHFLIFFFKSLIFYCRFMKKKKKYKKLITSISFFNLKKIYMSPTAK